MDFLKDKEDQKITLTTPKAASQEAYFLFTQNKYYVDSWESAIHEGNQKITFNFWATFYGPAWCIYLKLYRFGIIFSLIELTVICVAIFINKNVYQISHPAVTLLSLLIVGRVSFGFFANILYFNKAKSSIEKIVKSNISEMYFGSAVKSLGGINFGAALTYIFVNSFISQMIIAYFINFDGFP